MKITWYGHSAFAVEFANRKLLIDPFLSGNPSWDGGWESPAKGVTHVLLTHGHDDHLGDAFEICKATGAVLVANYEICMHAVGQGVSDRKINPCQQGGTVECGGFTASVVNAVHSSSTQTGEGKNLYLGLAGGIILHSADEKSLYHMGDTDIFGDMALINELHKPQIGIVPVGDRFTMGGAVAVLACRRFFDFETVIPCHYGTFEVIDQDANAFVEAMEEDAARVQVMEIGGCRDF